MSSLPPPAPLPAFLKNISTEASEKLSSAHISTQDHEKIPIQTSKVEDSQKEETLELETYMQNACLGTSANER